MMLIEKIIGTLKPVLLAIIITHLLTVLSFTKIQFTVMENIVTSWDIIIFQYKYILYY